MVKISVIVPVYNVEKYLKRCLDSIVNQTCQDFEIICVNDCATDNSTEIIDRYVKNYHDKIKKIDNKDNLGPGASRDKGIQAAEGEYIAFFDSDDYVKSDYLETYVQEAERSGADIVLGGYVRAVGCKETIIAVKDTSYTPWLYPALWMRLYRSSFLKEHRLGFRGFRIYEDNFFNYRCMLEAARVSIIDYCGYYYGCNPTSITKSKNGMIKYQQFADNCQEVYEEYCDSPTFQLNHDILEYAWLSAMLSCMLVQSRHNGKDIAYRMYQDYRERLQKMFPDYKKNRFIGVRKLKEGPKKERYATAMFIFAEKIGLGKMLMRLISR